MPCSSRQVFPSALHKFAERGKNALPSLRIVGRSDQRVCRCSALLGIRRSPQRKLQRHRPPRSPSPGRWTPHWLPIRRVIENPPRSLLSSNPAPFACWDRSLGFRGEVRSRAFVATRTSAALGVCRSCKTRAFVALLFSSANTVQKRRKSSDRHLIVVTTSQRWQNLLSAFVVSVCELTQKAKPCVWASRPITAGSG